MKGSRSKGGIIQIYLDIYVNHTNSTYYNHNTSQ